jgi:hypothetical protein
LKDILSMFYRRNPALSRLEIVPLNLEKHLDQQYITNVSIFLIYKQKYLFQNIHFVSEFGKKMCYWFKNG